MGVRRSQLTSVEGVAQPIDQIGQTGDHLHLLYDISKDVVVESEHFFQVVNDLRWHILVRIEVVGLRLALHLLSVAHLGVAVAAAAKGRQLTQDVLETFQRCVVALGLWPVSVKETHA